MRKESKKFFEKLVSAMSPSGFEQPAQRVYKEYVSPFCDSVEGDYTGNMIAVVKSKAAKPLKVMLSGHSDEIGLMVTHFEDTGQIRFSMIGGVDPAVLPGTQVVLTGKEKTFTGVIGRKAIHLLKPDERGKVEKENLWADFGFASKEEAQKHVRVGDPIAYKPNYLELENENVVSKGCDDKVGVFVVAETLRLLSERKGELKCDVYGVSSTMEEIGSRGAKTAADRIKPTVGIAIDVTHTVDYPGGDKTVGGDLKLGTGPVIARGANISPILFDMAVETAEKGSIPFQIEAEPGATGTDANVIQISGSGVATALISIPNRYMHTPAEVISLKDLENAAKLIAELILKLDNSTDLIPK